MMSNPPVPAHDTLVGFAPHFTSYGPRVDEIYHDAILSTDRRHIRVPNPGEEPHFWGVYRWDPDTHWHWIADCASEEIAYRLAVCWQEKMCHDR